MNRDFEADNCFPVACGDTARPSNSSREQVLSFSLFIETLCGIIDEREYPASLATALDIIDSMIASVKKILTQEFTFILQSLNIFVSVGFDTKFPLLKNNLCIYAKSDNLICSFVTYEISLKVSLLAYR